RSAEKETCLSATRSSSCPFLFLPASARERLYSPTRLEHAGRLCARLPAARETYRDRPAGTSAERSERHDGPVRRRSLPKRTASACSRPKGGPGPPRLSGFVVSVPLRGEREPRREGARSRARERPSARGG